jgi:hypothetical protein
VTSAQDCAGARFLRRYTRRISPKRPSSPRSMSSVVCGAGMAPTQMVGPMDIHTPRRAHQPASVVWRDGHGKAQGPSKSTRVGRIAIPGWGGADTARPRPATATQCARQPRLRRHREWRSCAQPARPPASQPASSPSSPSGGSSPAWRSGPRFSASSCREREAGEPPDMRPPRATADADDAADAEDSLRATSTPPCPPAAAAHSRSRLGTPRRPLVRDARAGCLGPCPHSRHPTTGSQRAGCPAGAEAAQGSSRAQPGWLAWAWGRWPRTCSPLRPLERQPLQSKRLLIEARWVSKPLAFAGALRPRRLNNWPL